MHKLAFIIDVALCENCNNCFLACKDEHCDNHWPGYTRPQPLHGQRWLEIRCRERGHFPRVDVASLPRPCMHCDDAPCVAAATGAIVKRDDGLVLIDPEQARGRRDLVASCPHGAIWYNETEQVPQKCTGCAHLLDQGWTKTRCVQACPTGALRLFRGSDGDLARLVEEQNLERLPECADRLGQARCYYRNLYRYTSCFLAGTLIRRLHGVEECAAGVEVQLELEGQQVQTTVSDAFGDFRFDDLAADSICTVLVPGCGLRTTCILNETRVLEPLLVG